MGYGKGVAPNVAFIRRYVMKDGSIKTNPGVNNPDIVNPVGIIDDSVNVIRFDREGADTIVFVNYVSSRGVSAASSARSAAQSYSSGGGGFSSGGGGGGSFGGGGSMGGR